MSKEHIKALRKSIKDKSFSIRLLKSEVEDLELELETEIKKTDLQILKENWKLILDYYEQQHPLFYSDIVVECFDLLQGWVRFGGTRICHFYLNEICDFWLNGGMREGQPIVSVIFMNYRQEKKWLYKTIDNEHEVEDESVKNLIPLLQKKRTKESTHPKTLSEWFNLIQEKATN